MRAAKIKPLILLLKVLPHSLCGDSCLTVVSLTVVSGLGENVNTVSDATFAPQ